MLHSGSYHRVENEFDIDHEINDSVNAAKAVISQLSKDLEKEDYRLVMKAIISEFVESL
jgi:hypothetical protein